MSKKQIIISFFSLIGVVILIWFISSRIGKTKVTISSDEGSKIHVSKFDEDINSFQYEEIGTTSATVYLEPGEYNFRVEDSNSLTNEVVTVSETEINKTIPLKDSVQKEELLFGVGYNLVKSARKYRFLDPRFDMLFTFVEGEGRAERVFLPTDDIVDVSWLNYNNGFIRTSRDFFVYRGGNVTKLSFPERNLEGDTRIVTYGYDSNDNNDFVININGNIYLYKNNFSSRELIGEGYQGLEPKLSNTQDVILYTGELANVEEAVGDKFILLKSPSYRVSDISGESPLSVSWGQEPGTIAVATAKGVFIQKIGSEKKELVYAKPIDNPTSLGWISENQLTYYDDEKIWLYNSEEKRSYMLVNVEERLQHRNPLYIKGEELYYSSSAAGGERKDLYIYRVDLRDF